MPAPARPSNGGGVFKRVRSVPDPYEALSCPEFHQLLRVGAHELGREDAGVPVPRQRLHLTPRRQQQAFRMRFSSSRG